MAEHTTPRRTRLVVDIEWRGHPGAEPGDEYYTDDELTGVATRWITDAFYDRDDSPHVTVTDAGIGAPADRGSHSGEALELLWGRSAVNTWNARRGRPARSWSGSSSWTTRTGS